MPVPESIANEIRNRAKEAVAEARRAADRPQGSVNETISEIESARPRRKSSSYRATKTYHYRCFYCGDYTATGFEPRLHEDVWGRPTPVHSCGHYPYEGLHPESSGLNIVTDIAPYYDISLGRNVKGAQYVEGKGVLIKSRQHLHAVARANGMECR